MDAFFHKFLHNKHKAGFQTPPALILREYSGALGVLRCERKGFKPRLH